MGHGREAGGGGAGSHRHTRLTRCLVPVAEAGALPPAGRAHTQLPPGPAPSRTPARLATAVASRSACPLSPAVTLQGPEGPGPDASQGAAPAPPHTWLGLWWGPRWPRARRLSSPLWGLRRGLRQLLGAVAKTPKRSGPRQLPSGLPLAAGDSARPSWALVWRRSQGWLRRRPLPGGPSSRGAPSARAPAGSGVSQRLPDAQAPGSHAHRAAQRRGRASRQRLGQRARGEPRPWLPAACGVPAWGQGLPTAATCSRRGSASAQVCAHPSCSPSRSGAFQGVSGTPSSERGQASPESLGWPWRWAPRWMLASGRSASRSEAGVGRSRLWLTLQPKRELESSEVGSGPRLCSQGT